MPILVSSEKWAAKAALFFFACLTLTVFATFQNYGVTWDEEFHRVYGEFILRWYQSFFADKAAVSDPFLIYYGGIFDVVCALVSRVSPWKIFETRHLLGALLGVWTVLMSYKTARRIGGSLTGLLAICFLAAFPAFYGHQFANPVDVPFAAFFITALYYLIRILESFPSSPLRLWIKLGLALGVALGVRASGLVILFPTLLFFVGVIGLKQCLQNPQLSVCHGLKWKVAVHLGFATAIAWIVMLSCWPWGQVNPVHHPFLALWQATQWVLPRPVFFSGGWFETTNLPPQYLIQSLLVSTPEHFIIALLVSAVLGLVVLGRTRTSGSLNGNLILRISVLLLPLVLSLIMNAFFQKTKFDGFRHYLFLIPILSILAAIGVAAFFRSRFSRIGKLFLAAGLLGGLALTIGDMVRLHPYQTVYFNRLFGGGLKSAVFNYETDYWGSSYKEGMEWVIKNYKPDLGRKIRVRNSSALFQVGYYIATNPEAKDRFEAVTDHPDIFLSTTRWGKHKMFAGKILHVVEREGVPLLYVVETLRAA